MKIRTGFVSNSSSSSFVVIRKKSGKSKEEIEKHNRKLLEKYYGVDESTDERIKEYSKIGEILVFTSVEYGAEESAESLVMQLCESFDIKTKDLKIIWEN